MLLGLSDLQPDLDENYPAVDDDLFNSRAKPQKPFALFLRRKPHHIFDPRPVVPTSVENKNLARGRKLLDIALRVHLRLFASGWRRQRYDAKHTWADFFGQCLDRSTLAGRVTPFKYYDDAKAFFFDPILKRAKPFL